MVCSLIVSFAFIDVLGCIGYAFGDGLLNAVFICALRLGWCYSGITFVCVFRAIRIPDLYWLVLLLALWLAFWVCGFTCLGFSRFDYCLRVLVCVDLCVCWLLLLCIVVFTYTVGLF